MPHDTPMKASGEREKRGATRREIIKTGVAIGAREKHPALEIWRHPSGALQLCTDYGWGGHRLFGPKLGGISKLVKRHELTEADCDELEEFVAKSRVALKSLSAS